MSEQRETGWHMHGSDGPMRDGPCLICEATNEHLLPPAVPVLVVPVGEARETIEEALCVCSADFLGLNHRHDCPAQRTNAVLAALAAPVPSGTPKCDPCGDTGRIPWMVEGDPNCYQEPDSDGMIPCPDCRPSGTPHEEVDRRG